MYEKELASAILTKTGIDVESLFEKPKDSKMGDLALPCFRLAKTMHKAPQLIAEELAPVIKEEAFVSDVEVVNGYVNIRFDRTEMARIALTNLNKENIAQSGEGNGKTITIDYSSVNIAKPFHIGHLSSTVIGGALYRIFKHLGYNVVGINHLGDWGTQFGKLIVATKKWSSLEEVEKNGIVFLNGLYVRFHQEAKDHPEYEDEARAEFKKIEDGDAGAIKFYEVFKKITLEEVGKVYDRLKIKFDSYNGEAFYNDKMEACLDILRDKKLLVESDGAQIVDLSEYGMPPCLLVRSDGATLYATRDIACAYYRAKEYDFYKNLYVVAYQQNLHFKQIFKVLELMGFAKYADCEHIAFGMVSLEDGAMSTREGRVIWLKDVLDQAVEKARAIINVKNPDLEDKEKVAESVGIGSVVFSVLYNQRIKDIAFSYDKVLNFDGETAPYIQYAYARCKSILRKAGDIALEDIDTSLITDEESYDIVKSILNFKGEVQNAALAREPYIVSRHIMNLVAKFNRFYIDHRIIDQEENIKKARLALVSLTAKVIKEGLTLLGIDAPEVM